MLTGLKDTDREILKYVEDKELFTVCCINKKMWYEVCDDGFIRRRLRKFGEIEKIEKYKKENESWKRFFSRAAKCIHKMKTEFDFNYTEGDFQKQYNIWKSENILVKAAEEGQLSIIQHCVENLNEDIKIDEDSVLTHASENGHLEVVKYALEKGCDIHASTDYALRWTSARGHFSVVEHLIKQGANIHAYDDDALAHAAHQGHYEIVKLLVEAGAYIHFSNELPLRMAAKYGYLSIVKYLVQSGADISANNYEVLNSPVEEVANYLYEVKKGI